MCLFVGCLFGYCTPQDNTVFLIPTKSCKIWTINQQLLFNCIAFCCFLHYTNLSCLLETKFASLYHVTVKMIGQQQKWWETSWMITHLTIIWKVMLKEMAIKKKAYDKWQRQDIDIFTRTHKTIIIMIETPVLNTHFWSGKFFFFIIICHNDCGTSTSSRQFSSPFLFTIINICDENSFQLNSTIQNWIWLMRCAALTVIFSNFRFTIHHWKRNWYYSLIFFYPQTTISRVI